MTKDEALRLALEALEKVTKQMLAIRDELAERGGRPTNNFVHEELWDSSFDVYINCAIPTAEAIKFALEAKDEKANDELRRLHDLLGKANALARIRANKIDELEQRLTKTEAQLGEAVWNYGELKREQLANQQKTSGSPINTSTALEAKDEPSMKVEGPLHVVCQCDKCKAQIAFNSEVVGYVSPQRTWVGLTDEEIKRMGKLDLDSNYFGIWYDFAKAIEAKLKEKNT
jgi:phage host-nuclease inhibitor protein Gam